MADNIHTVITLCLQDNMADNWHYAHTVMTLCQQDNMADNLHYMHTVITQR